MGVSFLDSNVLIYAYDGAWPLKQRIARELVLMAAPGQILVSTQVLTEFCNVMLHRMRARVEDVAATLDKLDHIDVVRPDRTLVLRALQVYQRYGLQYYDSMIIAAAERGGCERVYSEDMGSGQRYFGIEVVNPFA